MENTKLAIIWKASAVLLLVIFSQSAHADFSSTFLYDEEIKKARTMAPLDNNLFGENINLQDGTVSFRQTDVIVPTKNGGKIEFGRVSESRTTLRGVSPGWGMDVPYMVGTYDARSGWNVAGAGSQRCSSGKFAPSTENLLFYTNSYSAYTGTSSEIITTTNIVSPAHVFWHGIEINLPSAGSEILLEANPGQTLPTDGGVYYGTTKNGWRIGCIPSISGGNGEGFIVTLPDGTKYFFDLMVVQDTRDYIEYSNSTWMSNPNYSYRLTLSNYFLLATKVLDRFGNTITYSYDPASAGRLKSIYSTDGARIDFNHDSAGSISEITVANRKWIYTYLRFYTDSSSYTNAMLQSITLPDGSSWQFSSNYASSFGGSMDTDLWKVSVANFWDDNLGDRCKLSTQRLNQAKPSGTSERIVTMNHPSGAKGEFTFQNQFHGMNSTPGRCYLVNPGNPRKISFGPPTSTYTLGVPSVYLTASLVRKKLSGPGITGDLIWDYSYNPSWSFDYECANASACDNRSITTISSNDGKTRRYSIGNSYGVNLGKLLSVTSEQNGQVLEVASYSYVQSPVGQPYPQNTGNISLGTGVAHMYGNPYLYENHPLLSVTTTREGGSFTSYSNHFDVFSRPTSVSKYSSLGYSRTDTTEYHDNLSLWVLGQVKKQTTTNASPNGQTTTASMVSSEVEYNAQALPWKTYKFGKLQQILSYWPDGSVNTVTDGRGNVTWLGDYYRGIPRLVGHPDGTTESASVDGNGWITAVTDEIGAKTCYGYDAMGRVSSITYPSETQLGVCDTSRWHQTTIATEFINTAEHGIAAGHWRTALRHGPNAHINTYYDAMLRPVLEEKFDLNNIPGTLSQVVKRYDTSGRLSFQSYPTTNVGDAWTVTQGVRTLYDALDRVTRVEQDSEFGTLATMTEYLPGLKTRVTNARGFQTTTEYMAWDQPSYDLPILSQQPEGKTIQIARHPQFGWPLSLTQRNAANTLSQTRRYVYDSYALLCKTIEPETGATWFGYDEAGNLAASSAGLSLPDATNCNWSEGANSSRKVTRTYDQRNRLSTLNFPDGRGNQIWTYANDGLPASITTYNDSGNTNPVVNAYTYNNRRLLTGETTSQPGTYTWSIGYGYDAIGNLSNQTYPTGLNIDYAPNALGQPTKAGTYATGAQYYPNGALKQFTYGNGIVHTMTQNARQLPQRVTSSGGALDYSYVYDANGNPEHIANELVAGYDLRDRWMGYDGLDRLTDAGSASFGGDHWHRYTYDALDNIKSWKLAGVKDYAEYVYDNATNRLTSIRNTAGATVMGLDYDLQGNLYNKNGQIHNFDYGNRLRDVPGKESYRYDGLGRRVQTTKTDGSKTTLWQYSQSGQMLFSSDWDGANYANQKTHENVYLAGSIVATIDHDWPSNAVIATKYQHTDALGSPVAVTNTNGAVIERNDYEPYGAIIGKPTYSGIGYTGHVMDGLTGLTYMQQRYYDQSIGRFLSVDPVAANAATGRNLNRYKFAGNSPYRFVDPNGQQEVPASTPSTGIPLFDWLMTPSDVRASSGDMIEEQLVFENSQEHSLRDIVLYTAIAMSAGISELSAARGVGRGLSGPSRQGLGISREQRVAKILGGRVSNELVTAPGLGTTDIDVVAMNGDLVSVGGAAKGLNKGNLGRQLRIYMQIAEERGVGVKAYFAEGTPREIVDYAGRILGPENVTIFEDIQ